MRRMSYCLFRNTLIDLLDAEEVMARVNPPAVLSDEERAAMEKLIRLCAHIAKEYGNASS